MNKKLIFSVITSMALLCTVCAACGGNDGKEEHTEHDWVVDTVNSVAATCGESGTTVYKCECGETKSETVPATGNHSYKSGHECEVCGYVDMTDATADAAIAEYGYYHVDKDGSRTYTTGDEVSFGSYPQEVVADEGISAALGEKAGELPTAEASGDWISYSYYDEGAQADFAFYKDVELNGVKYRGVYLLNYRPYYSQLQAGGDYSYVDDSGFELNKIYWFEYAPVVWNVLGYEDGSLFLSAKYCVEGQPFQDLYEQDGNNLVNPETGSFVNDWENSSLRAFLNGEFYDLAFGATEKALIKETELENKSFGTNEVNDTTDNVFLLSYADLGNAEYFASIDKKSSFTDYSTIQGLRPSGEASTADGEPACSYILRTAGNKSYVVAGVSKQGSRSYEGGNIKLDSSDSYDNYAINGDLGVKPALYIKIGK